jgi:hypothetical protein
MLKKFVERTVSLYVPVKFSKTAVVDGRMGLVCGTVRSMCGQFGLRYKHDDKWLEVSGPADRIQKCLEKLHYGNIPYLIGSHP